ncbi:MFS transporter [Aquitalea sp.]|uniref:MFS transporter n=1 Tax=Aquitalea sp. TaxID=1872623 RepID=UPI0025846488|nr:MFS transporter [Aquitalea sp.]
MSETIKVDVAALIDASPIGRYQWLIFILCGICMVLDGFDVQAMAYVAPALLQTWAVDKSALGPVFSSGLLGLLLGSLLFSMLADRYGRRPVLIVSTLFFGMCMLLTALVTTLQQLMLIRFITGLGLGAIMPNAMALCGEYSPRRKRVSTMMLISCGFTLGAMSGGLVAALLIPRFGWQSVFVLGGILPILIALLMWRYLPESIHYQLLVRQQPEQARVLLQRVLSVPLPPNGLLQLAERPTGSMPLLALFQDGRRSGTLLLWLVCFLNMIALYFLSNWLPTLARLAGMSLERAVLVGAVLQLGGTLGTILMGWLIDRAGFRRILLPCFMLATVLIALIGHSVSSAGWLFALVFLVGFAVVGGQPAINAMAASFYPTTLRTTGVGWSLGIGRIGSVLGPMVGGQLIALNWTQVALFQLVALPSLLIVVLLLFGLRGSLGKGVTG